MTKSNTAVYPLNMPTPSNFEYLTLKFQGSLESVLEESAACLALFVSKVIVRVD